MQCNEFLERYSDYRDGRIPDPGFRAMVSHLALCESCRRFDARVSRGVVVLRSAPELQPSSEFHRRLRERLAHHGDASVTEPLTPVGGRFMAALTVAAALAVVVWRAADRPPEDVSPPPAAAPAPIAATQLPPSGDRASPPANPPAPPAPTPAVAVDLTLPAFGQAWRTPTATEEPFFAVAAERP
jgi:hypothetical protein